MHGPRASAPGRCSRPTSAFTLAITSPITSPFTSRTPRRAPCHRDHEHHVDVSTRRVALHRMVSLTALAGLALLPGLPANADNPAVQRGLNVYVKKKKLDRIDSYLPPLFLAKEQLIRVERIVDSPADARSQLRSGSFSGLRENVRSVGEYVSREKGDEQIGKKLVGTFFGELEAADFALLSASRSEEGKRAELVSVARARLEGTITALDALIAELPQDVVEKSRSIADAVDSLDAEAAMDEVNRDEAEQLRRLRSIL